MTRNNLLRVRAGRRAPSSPRIAGYALGRFFSWSRAVFACSCPELLNDLLVDPASFEEAAAEVVILRCVILHARICAGGGPSHERRVVPTAIGDAVGPYDRERAPRAKRPPSCNRSDSQ